ncbi:MAG: IS4 family transposase [Candidatus Aureabacteria bacterium]|nr:IS4 family transposase [Candidatus Auribacterota bacterium]
MIRVASCFAQVLSLIPRYDFERIVRAHQGERGAKGFSCWDQFVAMLFCQMGAAHTLREICGGLATSLGKVVHLGLRKAPHRSTLAYANEHRTWRIYEALFYQLLTQCRDLAAGQKRKFRFKNPLRSLDATVIDLCLSAFDWAKFRRTKGAIKLHLLLDHQGYLPCWAWVTEGKTHEVNAARNLHFKPGTIVAMDMAYNDYRLFAAWTREGVLFVSRMKENARYRVVRRHRESEKRNILRDETIRLTGVGAQDKCPFLLRRIVVWDEEHQREIELLTNIFHLAASTVATIYKERWQIEIFFKALKQYLKVKTFVGTSENAVKVQIWTALIAMLLLKFLQMKATWRWSLSNLAAMLRFNLLTYRDLWAWLNAPFQTPIAEPGGVQLDLWD